MRTELKALHQKLRTTTVYVTHDQVEAMTMADRIVVMNGGNIEQIGTPLELYNAPRNLFVAGFIGSPAMNLIEGRVVSKDGRPWLVRDGLQHMPLPLNLMADEGARIVFGFRPEHVELANDGIPAEVSVIEPTGPETLVTFAMGDVPVLAAIRDFPDLRPGDVAHISPNTDRAHIFDAESGNRLPRA